MRIAAEGRYAAAVASGVVHENHCRGFGALLCEARMGRDGWGAIPLNSHRVKDDAERDRGGFE